MSTHTEYTSWTLADREVRDNYQLMASTILPRPIAWVSTISASGVTNLAPFSFFTGVSANPPSVVFCPVNDRTGKEKDTVRNLHEVGEFVVNFVAHAAGAAMNQTSYAYEPEVSEFEAVGLTALPSTHVRPPRVAEAPVQFECKLMQIVSIGAGPLAPHMCIGQIVTAHVANACLTADGGVDAGKLDLIGRLGGEDYCTTRDRFALPRPTKP